MENVKVGFFKCRGLEDLLHWTLMFIAFYFSFVFYNDMLFGLMVAGLVFELMKPSLFEIGLSNKRSLKGIIFIVLGSIFILLSLMATCSALTNNYQALKDNSFKKIESADYKSQKQLETNVKAEIENLQKQLEEYPTLEQFQQDIPSTHSTNLTTVTANWQKGKQDIQDKIDKANQRLNSVVKGYKDIEQFEKVKIEGEYKSYTKLFALISEKIKVNADYIAISVFLLIAILIEIGIVTTKHIAVTARKKRLGIYQPSFEERLKDYNNQILEYNFKNMINRNNELYVAVGEVPTNRSYLPLPSNEINKKNNDVVSDPKVDEEPEQKEESQKSNPFKGLGKSLKDKKVIDFEEEKKREDKEQSENNKKLNVSQKSDKPKRSTGASKYSAKNLNLENIKSYFSYLLDTTQEGKKVDGYKKVAEKINITQGEALRIFGFLRDFGYLKTKDKTTKLTKKRDINLIIQDLDYLNRESKKVGNE